MLEVNCTLTDIAEAQNMTPDELKNDLRQGHIDTYAFVKLTNQMLEEELSAQILGNCEHTTSLSLVASEAFDKLLKNPPNEEATEDEKPYKAFCLFDTDDVRTYLQERYDEEDYDIDELLDMFGEPNEDPWEDFENGTLTREELERRQNEHQSYQIDKVIKAICADDEFERELSSAILDAKYASAYDMFCATIRDFEDEL